MTIAGTIKMTAEQYLQLGEDPPGVRLELVDGEIRVSPSPTAAHAWAVSQLLFILASYAKANRLGVVMSDTDHIVTEYTVRRPDVYFFSRQRVKLLDGGVIRHYPDLAVEVISPGSERTDRKKKFAEYQGFGIPCYWIVDPVKKTFEGFELRRKKYAPSGKARSTEAISLPPFEGLEIELAELWWPPRQ
ncbi:MAG: Uma2 family endonuclease [Phycisphaerae bacterium]